MPSSDFDLEATHHFQSGGRIEPIPTPLLALHNPEVFLCSFDGADWLRLRQINTSEYFSVPRNLQAVSTELLDRQHHLQSQRSSPL